ncbi:MAG: argininosuccinate lyase [Enterocloster bolteae]
MRKQTKLVAVLSTAALLAIGASMTSFAATGWAEEDGTWVYYNRDGERATDQWKKSGNNWYWLDSNGEMAIDQLIEDGDNYYYVDINGVMAANQWVAIDNEDAGEDDEPDHYWYYFQANGKALTNGDNDKVSLKTINGKKYAFDDEGKMLFGWVDADSAERIDNTDGEGFKDGDYYFGSEDDGAMTVGWLQIDITYSEATEEDYKYTAAAFNDDEDQTRWFYFKSNGKKVYADGDRTKDKTINGKKYAFDQYGAMVAEWSLDEGDLGSDVASYNTAKIVEVTKDEKAVLASNSDVIDGKVADSRYAQAWKYFNNVEDGARVSKGWFKVVPAENLNESKYNDDEDFWYYADGSGNLYAGEFKTIKGKKYGFKDDGRMISGLHFIYQDKYNLVDDADKVLDSYEGLDVRDDDDDTLPFDDEDAFLDSAIAYEKLGYKSYYFGGSDDGAMRTGKTTVEIDGDNHNFYFEKSGSNKGAGVTGEKDDKLYMSGMLLKADTDDKYQIIKEETSYVENKKKTTVYSKMDTDEFFSKVLEERSVDDDGSTTFGTVTKKNKDLKEAYNLPDGKTTANVDGRDDKGTGSITKYWLVNTSGKVIDTNTKSKDGNDYYIVTSKTNGIVGVYVED